MAPYKKCPQCHTKLHIRLWACSCGYTFAIKRSKPQKLSKKTEMRFIIENTIKPLPNDDEYTTIYNVQVIGVLQLDNYKSCLQCRARVEPLSPPLGKCTKEDYLMMQLFDLCPEQITARVLLQHLNDEGQYDQVTCSAFGDMVYQLANLSKGHCITKPPPQMPTNP